MNDKNWLNTFYSTDGRKYAVINSISNSIYVEFYQDEVIVGGVEIKEHNTHYAQSIAENFCNGILKLKPWSSNESIKSDLCKSNKQ